MPVTKLLVSPEPQEPRRTNRRSRPVDAASFSTRVDTALTAFATDVNYAVQMARAAVTIGRKRELWLQRRQDA